MARFRGVRPPLSITRTDSIASSASSFRSSSALPSPAKSNSLRRASKYASKGSCYCVLIWCIEKLLLLKSKKGSRQRQASDNASCQVENPVTELRHAINSHS
eukprot:1154299-Pelagomonas_calceolata.AAC.4